MRFEPTPDPDLEYEVEPRFSLERDVIIHLSNATGFVGCMINFSLNGFCVRLDRDLSLGEPISLDVAGWPPLRAHVAWSHDHKAGCRMDVPLAKDRYEAMILSAGAIDRAGEWSI
jgi:hypothetical protein